MTSEIGSLVSSEYKMKMRIFTSLLELMKTRSGGKITVNDICAGASISRSSFYHHFSDKYDIANWYALLLAQYGLYETGRSLTWHEGILKTLESMRAVDPFFQIMSEHQSGDFLAFGSIEQRQKNLEGTLTRFKGLNLTRERGMQIRAFALVETTLVKDWIVREDGDTASEFVDLLAASLPSKLLSLLEEKSPIAAPKPMLSLFPFGEVV